MSRGRINNIRRFREGREPAWSQNDLGHRCGLSQQRISLYEAGDLPLLVQALRIARALGKPVEVVFEGLVDDVDCLIGERLRRENEPNDENQAA